MTYLSIYSRNVSAFILQNSNVFHSAVAVKEKEGKHLEFYSIQKALQKDQRTSIGVSKLKELSVALFGRKLKILRPLIIISLISTKENYPIVLTCGMYWTLSSQNQRKPLSIKQSKIEVQKKIWNWKYDRNLSRISWEAYENHCSEDNYIPYYPLSKPPSQNWRNFGHLHFSFFKIFISKMILS